MKYLYLFLFLCITLFSSGEKAYLDIEITKLNTEILEVGDIDIENKNIFISNFYLNSSQSILLGENPEIFNSLFSVNGRIDALRKIAKESNLSILSDKTEARKIIIKYNELPSVIYAGIWDKSLKTLTKIYKINIHIPTFYKELIVTPENVLINQIVSFDSSENISVKIGEITSVGTGGGNSSLSFKNTTISIISENGIRISGKLSFKNPYSNQLVSSLHGPLQHLKNSQIFLSIENSELKKLFFSSSPPYKISLNSSDAEVIVSGISSEKVSLNGIQIQFSIPYVIDYLPSDSKIYIDGPFSEDKNMRIKIGSIYVHAFNSDAITFSPSNHSLFINDFYVGEGKIIFEKTNSHWLPTNTADKFYSDIFLDIPYSALKPAYKSGLPITFKTPFTLLNSQDGKAHHIGPYNIIVSNPSTPGAVFELNYLPPNTKIYLDPPAVNENLHINLGNILIQNLYKQCSVESTENYPKIYNNSIAVGNAHTGFKKIGSQSVTNGFYINFEDNYSGDIILDMSYASIKSALENKSSLKVDKAMIFTGTPDGLTHTLGPYEFIFSKIPEPSLSELILTDENDNAISSITIDHGILKKGELFYEQSSALLKLKRTDNSTLFPSEKKINFSFNNDGIIFLRKTSSENSIRSQLSSSEYSVTPDNSSASFKVVSTLFKEDIDSATAGTYSGTTILNITIDN